MSKQTKNKILNYLIKLIFLLLTGSFFEETVLMESIDENSNKENYKESWLEWLYNYKIQILIVSIIILLIGVGVYTFDSNNNTFQLEKIDAYYESLKKITNKELYYLLEVMPLHEHFLKEILELYNTNPLYIKQIKDPEQFKELILKIIEEVHKRKEELPLKEALLELRKELDKK
jgi:hypothetical protein